MTRYVRELEAQLENSDNQLASLPELEEKYTVWFTSKFNAEF
jgi:hypothetical protein